MSNKITIKDLGGLSDYATSITTFADQYETAIANSRRSFHHKNEGAEGDAITAFFAKLEELQSRVFDRYPEALRSYAKVVTTYHDAVTSAGFTSDVKSLYDDAETVATTLNGTQLTAVTDITESLKAAFDKAAAAMGTEAETVDEIDQTAGESLSAAADARKATATTLETAYSSFVSSLQGEIATLKALKTSLENTSYVLNIPPSTISTAINNGTLGADEMYYFDTITNKEDTMALTAVLSKNYDPLSTLKTEKISDNMYVIVSKELIEISDEGHEKDLNNFLKALGNMPQSRSTIFMEGLVIGSDKAQFALKADIMSTGDVTAEERKEFESRSVKYNNFVSMMSLLNAINFGAYEYYDPAGKLISLTPTEGYVQFSGDKIESIRVVDLGGAALRNQPFDPNGIEYNVDIQTNDRDHRIAIDIQKIKDLEKARQLALAKFVADLTISVTGVVSPEMAFVLTLGDALSSFSGSNGEDSFGAGVELTDLSSEQKDRINLLASIVQSSLDYHKNLSELSADEKKKFDDVRSAYIGSGGYLITDGEDSVVQSRNIVSVSAVLVEKELDTNGFRGYMESRGISISNDEKKKFDSKIIDYVYGQSNLKFNSMTKEQLDELTRIEDFLETKAKYGDDDFNNYLNDIGREGKESNEGNE